MPTEQPALRAPWVGIRQITQGNHGETSHKDYGTWDNTYAIDVGLNYDDVIAPADGIIDWDPPEQWPPPEGGTPNVPDRSGGIELFLKVQPLSSGIEIIFLHLSEIKVVKGQQVKQGDVIAKSGKSGWGHLEDPNTEIHLHFHIWSGSGSRDAHTMPISKLLLKGPIDGIHDNERHYYESKAGDYNPEYSLEDSEVEYKFFESIPTDEDCADFIRDITIPDDTEIEQGERFRKVWRLQNCSLTRTWSGVQARRISGTSGPQSFDVPTVLPEATIDLEVWMTAPETTGVHRATYQLIGHHDNGQLYEFGDPFWVQIVVIERTPPDITTQYIDALNSHDPNQVVNLYATNAAHVTGERTIQGHTALRNWYQSLFSQLLPDAVFTLTDFSGSGNSRHFTWTAVSPQGRVQNGSDTFGLADGKIIYHYTFFTIVYVADVVLVIDRSGSMAEQNKMQAAKAASRLFIDLMRPSDKIGIVPFTCLVEPCQEPSLVFPLTVIGPAGSNSTTSRRAKTFIDDLVAEGNTSIAVGLQAGLRLLDIMDPLRVMVLLSDGKENRDPRVTDTLLDQIRGNNIKVLTVALGGDADQKLLSHIAWETNGIYRFAPSGDVLQKVFFEILGRIYGENIVTAKSGSVLPGGTAEEKVLIDSTIGSTTFSLFWRGSELDLTLVQPDGSSIDPSAAETNPNLSFVSGGTYQFYKINKPQAGEWTMRIYGKSTPAEGESYSISVTAMSSMEISIKFDKADYFAGDPIKIEARIVGTIGDSAQPENILGATIDVTVDDPELNRYSLQLHDDGLHEDGEANDGLYANTFADTSLIGNYNFKVQVSGVNNRDGQSFTREYAFSQVLNDPTLRFPNTPVLDDFNRKNGSLGRSWSGAKSGYRIVGQQVGVQRGGPIYWRPGIVGSGQQAFITLARVAPAGLEQGLLLKVQGKANNPQSWRGGAISIFYSAREGKVGIKTCMPRQKWNTLAMFDVTLQDGDQLGGRAEAGGMVRAYVNSVEIGSVDVGSFFVGKGGHIGVWFSDADGAVLDDFGGGGAIAVPVIQSTDDAGTEPGGCIYTTDDGNINFGHCMDGTPIVSGFRFQNVLLPARATIVEAHLEFTVDGPYANEMALQFLGERSANAATFSEADRPSDRQITATMVPWAIPATNVWTFNQRRRTPAITSIVQELVNLPGWASGNAMAIIVRADPAVPGDTHRRVYAWDREASAAAHLVVIYTTEALAGGEDHDEDHDDNDDDDDNDR